MKKTNQPSFAVVRPLDWTTAFSEGQWEALQERYASGHSAGMTSIEDLDKFVLFAHDIAPDALKRYRLWVDTVAFGRGLESPFIGAGGMCIAGTAVPAFAARSIRCAAATSVAA